MICAIKTTAAAAIFSMLPTISDAGPRWARVIGGTDDDSRYAVVQAADGRYALFGRFSRRRSPHWLRAAPPLSR